MNNLLVLFAGSCAAQAGDITKQAFEPVFNGKNALQMSLEQAKQFPSVGKTVIFASPNDDLSCLTNIDIQKNENWTKLSVLQKIAQLQEGFDNVYFAFADCPFLDPALAGSLMERHIKYAAEYSYADGYPFGLAPEILSPGTAGILANILGNDDGPVERDMLFSVIQKDINAFDIEAEISAVDLRCHRVNLCADSKRNQKLLQNFYSAAGDTHPTAVDVERIVEEQPQILRTLPSFYPIQVYGGCPQKCSICPYPLHTDSVNRKDFMDNEKFASLLDKITAFSDDAIIDLSIWGEIGLHPQKLNLIEEVISRPQLSLIIETSGIGWKNEELEKIAGTAKKAGSAKRINNLAPLSWIVSLDTNDPQIYTKLRGAGFAEAVACAKKLFSLFPDDSFVQAVRTKGSEEDTEKFYRYWKDNSPKGDKNIIIQKYDDFCGSMEKKQASDISPVTRQCCWHIMRDMPILIDGTVPLCRENLNSIKGDKNPVLGNIFTDSLDAIWENGNKYYLEQCKKSYTGMCADCDEYYTYNF